ncbi:MAG: hypothetical protein NC118_04350 [Eubacterium sp.]|nr:hypothetical protein [Eubacterium sp.]
MQEKQQVLQEFNLTSDLFAGKVFEDIAACQELCRILLCDETIVLKNVQTQHTIRNLEKHSVELDILAEDIFGRLINAELQMYQETAPLKRSRYYLSSIDMSILEKSKDYYELPDVTIIYITRKDFIGGRRGDYQVHRMADGKGRVIDKAAAGEMTANETVIDMDNGLHERYFNLEYPTEDEKINELLRYMENSDPLYQTVNFPRIVERVHYFKMQKEGVNIMCEIADRIRREGIIEGKIESTIELLEELGKVPQRIMQRLQQETNMDVIGRWLKTAARASSIAEFEEKM